MRQGRAHGVVILRADHDVAVSRLNFPGQLVELFGNLAPGVGKVWFENRVKGPLQRINDLHLVVGEGLPEMLLKGFHHS